MVVTDSCVSKSRCLEVVDIKLQPTDDLPRRRDSEVAIVERPFPFITSSIAVMSFSRSRGGVAASFFARIFMNPDTAFPRLTYAERVAAASPDAALSYRPIYATVPRSVILIRLDGCFLRIITAASCRFGHSITAASCKAQLAGHGDAASVAPQRPTVKIRIYGMQTFGFMV